MVIRPLNDRTYCAEYEFTHLGLWQNLYDCHYFAAIQCVLKCDLLTFLPLDKAVASRAVVVIVSGSDGRTSENAFPFEAS